MLALRAVVADTQELRTTPHDAALSFLFTQKQNRAEGFKTAVGHMCFIFNVLVVYLSLLCFKARETHCTPKHASWFNAAEIEINVMNVECTGKRVNDIETLTHELTAWTKKE